MIVRTTLVLAAVVTLTVACSGDDPPPTIEARPQAAADAGGVSIEEATRRLALQPAIGELGARIQANEADTFAGLWIDNDRGATASSSSSRRAANRPSVRTYRTPRSRA